MCNPLQSIESYCFTFKLESSLPQPVTEAKRLPRGTIPQYMQPYIFQFQVDKKQQPQPPIAQATNSELVEQQKRSFIWWKEKKSSQRLSEAKISEGREAVLLRDLSPGIVLSCDYCRGSHLACDHKQPCVQCRIRNIECSFSIPIKGQISARKQPVPKYPIKANPNQQPLLLDKLERKADLEKGGIDGKTWQLPLPPLPFSPVHTYDSEFDPLVEAVAPPVESSIASMPSPIKRKRSRRLSPPTQEHLNIAANVRVLYEKEKTLKNYDEFAERLHVSSAALYRLKNGWVDNPQLLDKILTYFKVTYQELCSADFYKTYQPTIKKPAERIESTVVIISAESSDNEIDSI